MSGLTEEQVENALQTFFESLDRESDEKGKKCFVVGKLPQWDEEEDAHWAQTDAEKASDEYKEWLREKQARDSLRTPEELAKIERAWLPMRSKDIMDSMMDDFNSEMGDAMLMQTTSTSYSVFLKFQRQIQKAKREAARGGDKELFLYLWALTMIYRKCDYSFQDTDMPQEGQKHLATLARLWKKILARPAEELEVDEASKQAVISSLETWKEELAEHEYPYVFDFRPSKQARGALNAALMHHFPPSDAGAGSSSAGSAFASVGSSSASHAMLQHGGPMASDHAQDVDSAGPAKRPADGPADDAGERKTARPDGSGEGDVAEFQRHLSGLPSDVKDPGLDAALQLRFIYGSQYRVLILSGNAPMFKLNQFISELFGVAKCDFTSNPQKGTTGEGTHFLITRPVGPGQCTEAWVCARQKVGKGRRPFVDHKALKVGHLFRGISDGQRLVRDEGDAQMRVHFVHPQLQHKVEIKLEGVMPNKHERTSSGAAARQANTCPLPRLVGWSEDFSEAEAKRLNLRMAEGRQGQRGGMFMGNQEVIKAAMEQYSLTPLFHTDGSDWRGPGPSAHAAAGSQGAAVP
mmetsp:Transcript_1346/g.3055  ORF Transcript_1346/g.3055 Transcript_1346/m.3055 type:complete len:578 (-) Transcript_1346:322-2055(-)